MTAYNNSSADNIRSRCFANLHMTPEEYGVWDVLRSVSHTTGTLYFDGRNIAGYFARTGKDVIYRIVKSLVRKGWLLVQAAGRNTRNGVFMPTQYQVLSHEQWAEDHPGECIASDPQGSIPENENGSLPETESSLESPTGSVSKQVAPVVIPRLVQSGKPEQPVVIPRTASRETPTGPVVIPRTTSLESPTYIVKEISLSGDSAVRHHEEEDTDPSILRRASHEKRAGWSVGCIASLLEQDTDKPCVPNKDEIEQLNALAAKHGDLAVVLAFFHFLYRDKTLAGVAWPLKLFFKEADAWLRHAVRELDGEDPLESRIKYVVNILPTSMVDALFDAVPDCSRQYIYPIVELAKTDHLLVDDYLTHHSEAQVIDDLEKFNAIRDAVVSGTKEAA